MTKNKLQAQYDKMMAEANKLKETIDSMPAGRWRADLGGSYYTCDNDGQVEHEYENDNKFDNFCFSTGNYFKTKEEAQEYKERILAEQELLELCDWDGTHTEWRHLINYSNGDECFTCFSCASHISTRFCFQTDHAAREAIKALGDKKLKLIYGIK